MLYKIVAFLAAILPSASAEATTYIGKFEGIMTNGKANYIGDSDYGNLNSDYISYDLTGLPVFFKFILDIEHVYLDGHNYNYVNGGTISGNIQFPPGRDARVENGSTLTNDSDYYRLSYYGNQRSANMVIWGNVNPNQNHFAEFDITFNNANKHFGPLQGGGRLGYSWGEGGHTHGIGNFVLTAGRVYSLGVPEPSTWAMMLTGFGAIGGMARRRQNRNRIAYT